MRMGTPGLPPTRCRGRKARFGELRAVQSMNLPVLPSDCALKVRPNVRWRHHLVSDAILKPPNLQ